MRLVDKALSLARQKGINQAAIARTVGVVPARVTDWKNGTGRPSIDQALRIARLLDVPLDWLADEEADEIPAAVAVTPAEKQALIMVRSLELTERQVVQALSACAAATRSASQKPSETPVARGQIGVTPGNLDRHKGSG